MISVLLPVYISLNEEISLLGSCELGDDGGYWLVMIRTLPVRSPERELQARAAQLVVGHLRAARSARLCILKNIMHTFADRRIHEYIDRTCPHMHANETCTYRPGMLVDSEQPLTATYICLPQLEKTVLPSGERPCCMNSTTAMGP